MRTVNPYSGQVLREFTPESFSSAEKKVLLAKRAFEKWSQLEVARRHELVVGALSYFETHQDLIAKDISEQMGRPLHQAKGELRGFFERARYMCSIALKTLAPDEIEPKAGFQRSIHHVPLGVVFVISAWNYPLLITVNSVVPALIAGDVVLLKHSSLTPAIGEHFMKAFGALGAVEGTLQNLILDHEVTGRLIEECDIDHVVFTGSVDGGRQILGHTAKARKFMTPQLELGGKDGAYVAEDADINHAVDSVVDGALFNSGQSCCGIERAFVHEKVFDEFILKAKKMMEGYVLGDPAQEKTSLGPLVSAKAADVMVQQVEEAVKGGATLVYGGKKRLLGRGVFFEPTLLTGAAPQMSILREENFGPILPVVKVRGLDEAISLINDSHYGLTSAIFTKDLKKAEKFARSVDTGTVFMNRCDYLDPALPWTGVRDSGCGTSLSKYGFYGLTRRKGLHFKILES